MTTCQPTILFEQTQFCIAQCQHCQRVGLTYHNLSLGFSQDEFTAFCRVILDTDFCRTCVRPGEPAASDLATLEPYLLIRTGHPDIQFRLVEPEFSQLQDGLHRALRRLNLYALLRSQLN